MYRLYEMQIVKKKDTDYCIFNSNQYLSVQKEILYVMKIFTFKVLPVLVKSVQPSCLISFGLDPLCQTLSVFRKFLVKLSDDLNQAPFIEKMKEYLRNEGDDVSDEDVCPLDIFQKMVQTCVISPNELSKLTKMMEFCSRNDLMPRIDEFINSRGVFRKGKVKAVDYSWFPSAYYCCSFLFKMLPHPNET